MSMQTDVLVIGSGPVGLTLANELTRHGAAVRVVDRADAIREVSKAMILHVRTQEILDKVGIAEWFVREAQPLREVVVHAYGKHIGSWDLDDIDSPYTHPLIIGQNRTQHALLDLLADHGVRPEWNTEAVAIALDDEGVTTSLKHADGRSEEARSAFVVGCEGSNSLVRKSLNFTFEGDRYTGEQFIQADCRIKWGLPKGRSYLFLTSDGYLMVIEFPDGVVRVFISLPDNATSQGSKEAEKQLGAVESTSETPTLDEVAHHLSRLTGFACELTDPIWLARYRTSHRYANRFSQGRAFIAGDAGHVHVPIGGQGMNTGIQDAFNLGWKLAGVVKGDLQPQILESYQAERHPVAESLIRGTNFAYKGILHPSELRQGAARMFGPYLIRNSRVQDFMRSTLEELKVFYPDSPLNLDLGGAKGPKPGERILDADLVSYPALQTVSINELTRSSNWVLLLFSGTGPDGDILELARLSDQITSVTGPRVESHVVVSSAKWIPPVPPAGTILIDELHIAHGRYGISNPGFYLIRPDTYVAARGPIGAATSLISHLRTIFKN